MGFSNPTTWPLRDFGSVRWEELKAKEFDWFLQQARVKKDAPLSMLRQFREVLPRMKHVESNNRLDCNLLVAVTLVGHMRHFIVHAGGFVHDKPKFAHEIVSKLGYSGSGMSKHLDFIEQTLLVKKSDGAIYLLNIPAPDSNAYVRTHYDILDELVRYLLAYAHQLYLSLGGKAIDKFDELPPREGSTEQPFLPDDTKPSVG